MSIDFIFLNKRKIKTVSQGEIQKNPAKKYISIQAGCGTQKTINFDGS